MHLSHSAGRLMLAPIAALIAAVCFVPAAGAAVTNTTITASTIKAYDMYDSNGSDLPINDRTVGGTVDSGATAGDDVNLICVNHVTGSNVNIVGSTKVTAAKKWSLTFSLSGLSGSYCRLVAVPSDVTQVSSSDLTSKYKGSRIVSVGYWSREDKFLGGAPGNVFVSDYEIDHQSMPNYYWSMYSLGSCGLCNSKVRNPATGGSGNPLWYYNASTYDVYTRYLTPPASGPDAEPMLLVDRKLALDPYMMSPGAKRSAYRFGSKGGVTVSYAINQANGDITIKESSPLYYCPSISDPSQLRECTLVNQTGVRFNRVITVTAGQMIWRSADTFSSADGKAHSVRVTYANNQNGSPGFRFGTSGDYKGSTKGDKSGAALGAAPRNAYAVVGVRRDRDNTSVSADNPVGDVVMSPRPALVRFFADNASYFYPRWNLSVPKKGNSPTVKQAYTVALSDANLTKLRNTAIAGLAR